MTSPLLAPLETLDWRVMPDTGLTRLHVQLPDGGQMLAEFRPQTIDLFLPTFSWARDPRNDRALPGSYLYPRNAGQIPYATQDRKGGCAAAAIDPAAVLSRALHEACGEEADVRTSLAIRIVALALAGAPERSGLFLVADGTLVLPSGTIWRRLRSRISSMLDGVRTYDQGKIKPIQSLSVRAFAATSAHARVAEHADVLATADALGLSAHLVEDDLTVS